MKWDSSDGRPCAMYNFLQRVLISIFGLGGFFFNREKQFIKMNPGQNLNFMGNYTPYWEWYDVFNPYIIIYYHSYGGNHINGIIDLTDKWWIRPQHHSIN